MNNEERENAKRILLAGRFEIMRADGSTFQTDDIEQFNKAREYGLQALDLQAVFERDFCPTSFEVGKTVDFETLDGIKTGIIQPPTNYSNTVRIQERETGQIFGVMQHKIYDHAPEENPDIFFKTIPVFARVLIQIQVFKVLRENKHIRLTPFDIADHIWEENSNTNKADFVAELLNSQLKAEGSKLSVNEKGWTITD